MNVMKAITEVNEEKEIFLILFDTKNLVSLKL